jgi:flagellar biosynthesis/type III secretory pathway protein FliH
MGRFSVAGLLLVCTTVLFAQERHLGTSPGAGLFTRSVFAHGYMHGYEEGFHGGDLDVQLGRDARDPGSLPSYKKLDCYHKDFGPQAQFKAGFEDGFRAGYSDAVRLRPFRAMASLKEAAQGLTELPQAAKKEKLSFDDGFREGYRTGRRQGASDGRDSAASTPIVPPCLGLPDEYCQAFGRAFLIGYSDGYANQSPTKGNSKVQVASGQ